MIFDTLIMFCFHQVHDGKTRDKLSPEMIVALLVQRSAFSSCSDNLLARLCLLLQLRLCNPDEVAVLKQSKDEQHRWLPPAQVLIDNCHGVRSCLDREGSAGLHQAKLKRLSRS